MTYTYITSHPADCGIRPCGLVGPGTKQGDVVRRTPHWARGCLVQGEEPGEYVNGYDE